jgi:hypothetical protein
VIRVAINDNVTVYLLVNTIKEEHVMKNTAEKRPGSDRRKVIDPEYLESKANASGARRPVEKKIGWIAQKKSGRLDFKAITFP